MHENAHKSELHQIAAWYSFISPLAAAAFFVIWNHGDVLDWVPPELLEALLFSVFSSAFVLALVTLFTSRRIIPRPVREIACMTAVVSAFLLWIFVAMITHAH
jgi:hypothetical protein